MIRGKWLEFETVMLGVNSTSVKLKHDSNTRILFGYDQFAKAADCVRDPHKWEMLQHENTKNCKTSPNVFENLTILHHSS